MIMLVGRRAEEGEADAMAEVTRACASRATSGSVQGTMPNMTVFPGRNLQGRYKATCALTDVPYITCVQLPRLPMERSTSPWRRISRST